LVAYRLFLLVAKSILVEAQALVVEALVVAYDVVVYAGVAYVGVAYEEVYDEGVDAVEDWMSDYIVEGTEAG